MKESLEQEIKTVAKRHWKYAERNHNAGYSIVLISIIGSIAASIIAVFGDLPKYIFALVAIIPAAALSIKGTLMLEEKSIKHWNKAHRLFNLLRALRYEGLNEAEASKQFSEIEIDFNKTWIRFDSKGEESK